MNLIEPIPQPDLTVVKRAHFMAVDGAGMSPIAHLWHSRGVVVDGCDQSDSAVADALRADGVGVSIGHDPAHLQGVDTVVVSSAIRESNAELVAARGLGLRVWHRSAALAALMAGHIGVAVSGTHGKSTTSAMIAQTLRGLDPSYVIGATPLETGLSYREGAPGGVFVVEADESDGSYLQYEPSVVVLTNIEVDHLDRWGTPQSYADGFRRFAGGPSVRRVVLSADDPGTAALAAQFPPGACLTFGEAEDADVRLTGMGTQGMTAHATLVWAGGEAALRLRVPGLHNLRNAAASIAAAVALQQMGVGIDLDDVIAALRDFRGLSRRFEVGGRIDGVTIVDDYAHHPTEIATAISSARAVIGPNHRLIVCFQPHLFTRTRDFSDDFGAALAMADLAVVCDVYPAREDPIPGVDGRLVVATADAHGASTIYTPTLAEAVDALSAVVCDLAPGDLIMTVGAGDVTSVGPALLARLGNPSAGGEADG